MSKESDPRLWAIRCALAQRTPDAREQILLQSLMDGQITERDFRFVVTLPLRQWGDEDALRLECMVRGGRYYRKPPRRRAELQDLPPFASAPGVVNRDDKGTAEAWLGTSTILDPVSQDSPSELAAALNVGVVTGWPIGASSSYMPDNRLRYYVHASHGVFQDDDDPSIPTTDFEHEIVEAHARLGCELAIHELEPELDICEMAGACHGSAVWCSWCGDVARVCDGPWVIDDRPAECAIHGVNGLRYEDSD